METEVMTDIDELYSMISDLAGALAELGEAVGPFVNRLNDLEAKLLVMQDRLILLEKNWE